MVQYIYIQVTIRRGWKLQQEFRRRFIFGNLIEFVLDIDSQHKIIIEQKTMLEELNGSGYICTGKWTDGVCVGTHLQTGGVEGDS